MKRFSRKWFSQIMINKLLKRELDQLKSIVARETLVTWNLSYGDVISYLIKDFKKSRRIESLVEPKLLTSVTLDKSGLNLSIPLKKVTTLSSTTKLDGKQRVSYSLEN